MEGSAVDPDGAAEPVEGFLWFGVPSQERGSDSWTRGALLVLAEKLVLGGRADLFPFVLF